MGTNYYVVGLEPLPGNDADEKWLHIGKSSMGWAFLFQSTEVMFANKIRPLRSTQDWWGLLTGAIAAGCFIQDEYGARVTLRDFWEMVELKRVGRAQGIYQDEGDSFAVGEFS